MPHCKNLVKTEPGYDYTLQICLPEADLFAFLTWLHLKLLTLLCKIQYHLPEIEDQIQLCSALNKNSYCNLFVQVVVQHPLTFC